VTERPALGSSFVEVSEWMRSAARPRDGEAIAMKVRSFRFIVTCGVFLAACAPVEAERREMETETAAHAQATGGPPVRLVWCTSADDPSVEHSITIDDAYVLRWWAPWGADSSKLTSASMSEDPELGPVFGLDTASTVGFSMGNFDEIGSSLGTIFCSGAPQIDTALRDRLVAVSDASKKQQQPFASCTFPGHAEAYRHSTITARPHLGGVGAIIEGTYLDRGYVLQARRRVSGPNGETTYLGEGGLSVYQVADPIALSRLVVSAGAAPTLSWDANWVIGENTCTVVGADYVASLVPPTP
jgi:hypothetical protein